MIPPFSQHDDERILETAVDSNGVVVSNDKYHDYAVKRAGDEAILHVIRSRLMPYRVEKTPLNAHSSFPNHPLSTTEEGRYFVGFTIELERYVDGYVWVN